MKEVTSDLIYILNKNKSPIPRLIYSEPTKTALEQFTTLLHRNIIPEIIANESSQVIVHTFEGEES